jgi:NCS1 family nucleobase:cation symporter-1
MRIFPVEGLGAYDEVDYYGAFTAKEAAKLGIAQLDSSEASLEGVERIEPLQSDEKGPKTDYVVTDGAY